MTPAEFAAEIVAPTLAEFKADPTSRRRAYLAAVVVYHLRDYLAEALAPLTGDPKVDRRLVGEEAKRVDAAVRAALPSPEPFDTVQGVANGAKHALTRQPHAVPFTAGSDWEVPPAFAGMMICDLSFFDDLTGGREIAHGGGGIDLYSATAATFRAFGAAFPAQLDGISMDPSPEGQRAGAVSRESGR